MHPDEHDVQLDLQSDLDINLGSVPDHLDGPRTTSTAPGSATTSPPTTATASSSSSLAETGLDVLPTLVIALVLLGVGAELMMIARNRRGRPTAG